MIVSKHKEVYCDVCGKNIGMNYMIPFGMRRIVRIKSYFIGAGGKLKFDGKMDVCWSCYSGLVSGINAAKPMQCKGER